MSDAERLIRARLGCVDRVGDVEFADPYRDLEDESPEAREWVAAQNEAALGLLSTLPLSELERLIEPHQRAALLGAPIVGGESWYWLRRDLEGSGVAVDVSTTLDGPRTQLVSVSKFAPFGDSIEWLHPSPDGAWLALGVALGGDEQTILYLGRTDGTMPFSAQVLNAFEGHLCWLPDSSALYCLAGRGRETEAPAKRLFLVPVEGRAEQVELPPAVRDRVYIDVHSCPAGRYLAVSQPGWAPCLRAVLDRESGTWMPGLNDDVGLVFTGIILGDRYIAVTNDRDPRCRVISAPLHDVSNRSQWRELVPSSSTRVIHGITPYKDGFMLYDFTTETTSLRCFTADGKEITLAPMPPGATVIRSSVAETDYMSYGVPVQTRDDEIVFCAASAKTSGALYRMRSANDTAEVVTEPAFQGFDAVVRSMVAGNGGEGIRFDLIAPAGATHDGPRPLLLTGYGGFNAAQFPPTYPGAFTAWVQSGGSFVLAQLPGDGTDGTDQWLTGRREHKQRTFDGLIAVAEHLIGEGLTSTSQLAICGASNGGLLVGAAITQRPELFAAAAMLVPVTDMARHSRERFGECLTPEIGDERSLPDAEWLRAYSPYHNVKPGVRYPPTILISGERDARVHPWHARKMAAALRSATDDQTRVLLREHPHTGHMTAALALASPARMAEWMGFLMHHVGLQPGDAAASSATGV
jgi:prolyl oligopeptidase